MYDSPLPQDGLNDRAKTERHNSNYEHQNEESGALVPVFEVSSQALLSCLSPSCASILSEKARPASRATYEGKHAEEYACHTCPSEAIGPVVDRAPATEPAHQTDSDEDTQVNEQDGSQEA